MPDEVEVDLQETNAVPPCVASLNLGAGGSDKTKPIIFNSMIAWFYLLHSHLQVLPARVKVQEDP